jgi:hypothetical protein
MPLLADLTEKPVSFQKLALFRWSPNPQYVTERPLGTFGSQPFLVSDRIAVFGPVSVIGAEAVPLAVPKNAPSYVPAASVITSPARAPARAALSCAASRGPDVTIKAFAVAFRRQAVSSIGVVIRPQRGRRRLPQARVPP